MLLERSTIAFTLLKFAGAAYLGYLGVRSVMTSFAAETRSTASPVRLRLRHGAALWQGFLNNLLNPKAGAFFVAVLPQFLAPRDAPTRLVLMMLAYDVMVVIWLTAYGLVVSRAGRSLAGPRFQQIMERATGLVLIGLGVRLALESA